MRVKTITSLQNEAYKHLLKLGKVKRQQEENVFLVEGIRAFKEVVKAKDFEVKSIWLEEDLLEKLPEEFFTRFDCPIYGISKEMLSKASDTVTHQGILAVVERKTYALKEVLASGQQTKEIPTLAVVLEHLQDPGNMGTILRTADAAGCSLVIVTEDCTDEYAPKVVRSAMGSLLHLKVCHVKDVQEASSCLKEAGFLLLAGHLGARRYPYDVDLTAPVALMIGNEGNGLTEEAAKAADILVKLPMMGQAESLNASVAAGVLLYEVVRQRL